jgi:hypothetical protein
MLSAGDAAGRLIAMCDKVSRDLPGAIPWIRFTIPLVNPLLAAAQFNKPIESTVALLPLNKCECDKLSLLSTCAKTFCRLLNKNMAFFTLFDLIKIDRNGIFIDSASSSPNR